jgi:FolB domain-containing protein
MRKIELNYESLDKIRIKDLLLRCIIGLNPDERVKKQDVLINLTLFADLKQACKTDDINTTVDYKDVTKQIIQLVENSSYFLIEKLAEEIASLCIQSEPIRAVQVEVDKPGALRFTKSVSIEIFRQKEDKTIKGFEKT